MRNLFTTIVFALLPMLAFAQSYFKDGTTWETTLSEVGPGNGDNAQKESVCTVTLNGAERVDGYDALRMYQSDDRSPEPKLYAYVRCEGDKVMIKPCGVENAKWYLMYDFGLAVGEGCYVYGAWDFCEDREPCKTYMECVAIEQDAASGLTAMTVREVYKGFDEGTFVWYKGLSSKMGVLYNNGLGLDGIGRMLTKAVCDGKTVYSRQTTGVGAVEHDAFKAVVNGLHVDVTNIAAPCQVALYAADGKLIESSFAGGGSARLLLPAYGVYVLKVGERTLKIVAVH